MLTDAHMFMGFIGEEMLVKTVLSLGFAQKLAARVHDSVGVVEAPQSHRDELQIDILTGETTAVGMTVRKETTIGSTGSGATVPYLPFHRSPASVLVAEISAAFSQKTRDQI